MTKQSKEIFFRLPRRYIRAPISLSIIVKFKSYAKIKLAVLHGEVADPLTRTLMRGAEPAVRLV